MLRSNPSIEHDERDDEGSAALEFIVVGLLLLVPLVYLIVALGAIQTSALGAEAAARHLARTVSTAADASDADQRAARVLDAVATEYGMDPDAVEVTLTCRPAASDCPTAGATLLVTVSTRVALPLVPSVFGLDRRASIPVEALAVQKVSRFWGVGG